MKPHLQRKIRLITVCKMHESSVHDQVFCQHQHIVTQKLHLGQTQSIIVLKLVKLKDTCCCKFWPYSLKLIWLIWMILMMFMTENGVWIGLAISDHLLGYFCHLLQYSTNLLSLCREIFLLACPLHKTLSTSDNKTSTI